MAICEYCGREMTTADGCICDTIEMGGKLFKRFRVGDPGGMEEMAHETGWDDEEKAYYHCPDCNAKYGEYHHPGCDMEACPNCGQQLLLGCDCVDKSGRVRVLVDWPNWKEYLK